MRRYRRKLRGEWQCQRAILLGEAREPAVRLSGMRCVGSEAKSSNDIDVSNNGGLARYEYEK